MVQQRPKSSRRRPAADQSPTPPPDSPGRRRFLPAAIGGLVVLAVVAVVAVVLLRDRSGGEAVPTPTVAAAQQGAGDAAAARALVPEMTGPPLQVFPAGGVHAVGQDRFAIGLVDEQGKPVQDGTVDLLFFTLANNQGTLTEALRAPFLPYGIEESAEEDHDHGSEITGVFVARPTFGQAGPWGVVAKLTLPDGSIRAGQADFAVTPTSPVPGPGAPAIASRTLTATTAEDAKKICTADPPDDMHAISLDEGLKNGKPTVVLFATPLLCASRTCGPSLEAIAELHRRYGEAANFVHVELYPERDGTKPAPAMGEWNLPSEPWLFLIDAQGKVVDRYEGGIGLTETAPAVQRLVGATADVGRGALV